MLLLQKIFNIECTTSLFSIHTHTHTHIAFHNLFLSHTNIYIHTYTILHTRTEDKHTHIDAHFNSKYESFTHTHTIL